MVKPLATNLLHFHLNELFKMVSNLALFCLANYLATFQKIGAIFSESSGHPDHDGGKKLKTLQQLQLEVKRKKGS